jgi:hypothetical protein
MNRLPETITISREDLPSGEYDVILKCPYFGDWRKARKLYPNDMDSQGRRKSPGYAAEELLLCQQIVDVVDKDNKSVMGRRPKDVIDRLKLFTIPDRQALLTIFLEMFWVGADQAKQARDLANEFMVTAALTYTIEADKMPMSGVGITYNAVNTGTQMAADRRYIGVQEQGCTLEELLFATCVSAVEGVPVEQPKDSISLLDEWTIADVQFAKLVFVNQFTLDEAGEDRAKEAGKRYLEKLGLSKPGTTPAPKPKQTSKPPANTVQEL